jgi:hypothetical protein
LTACQTILPPRRKCTKRQKSRFQETSGNTGLTFPHNCLR